MTAVGRPLGPISFRMNEIALFAKIAEIQTRNWNDVQKCDAVFSLIAATLRQGASIPASRGFKIRLRRCLDEFYARAMKSCEDEEVSARCE